jgi:hypothetical protein
MHLRRFCSRKSEKSDDSGRLRAANANPFTSMRSSVDKSLKILQMQRAVMGFFVLPSEARGTTAVFAHRVGDNEIHILSSFYEFPKAPTESGLL